MNRVKNKIALLVLVFVILGQLAISATIIPNELPPDSHFVLSVSTDPTGFLTTTGVRGIRSSVLATRQGIFGLDLGAGFSLDNDTFGLGNIGKYGTELTDELKDEIIELAGEDGIKIKPHLGAGANLQIGIFGFGVRAVCDGEGYLSRDLLELILKGNQLNRTYNLDPDLKLAIFGDAKAQVAFKIPLLTRALKLQNLAFGIAYHHIPGGVYATVDSDVSYTAVYTEEEAKNTTQLTGDLYLSQKGVGSAFDVGILLRPNKKLYLAAALDGIKGEVKWTDFKYYDLSKLPEDKEMTPEEFAALGTPVAGEITQTLPLTLRIGARYDLLNWFKLFAEASRTSLQDKSSHYNIALGTDLTLLWLFPLKASVSYDSRYNRAGYSLGAGLKLLFLEAAAEAFAKPSRNGDELGVGVSARLAF